MLFVRHPQIHNIGSCYIKLVTINFKPYYWNINFITNIIRLTIKVLAKQMKGTAGGTNKHSCNLLSTSNHIQKGQKMQFN